MVPLAGLSWAAIERWCAKNNISTDSRVVAQISEISRKSDLLVDRSRDTFEEEEIELTISLKSQIQCLEAELKYFKS
jgi:hypothetical protein